MAMEITNNYSNAEQVNAEKEMQAKASRKETEKKSTYGSRREYSEYLNETVSIPQLSWGNNRCKWR